MNSLLSIEQIYNFFCNYYIDSWYTGLLRIITIFPIIIYYTLIIPDILLFIEPDGIFSYSNYLKFCKEKYGQISLYNKFGYSRFNSYLILIIFFISGLTATLGLLTNISLWIFLITMISVQSRIFPIIYTSGDVLSRVIVLCLCFTNCSSYSIDKMLGLSQNYDTVDGWAIRIVQITVVFGAYFGSGFRKITDHYWVNGESLHNALNNHFWGLKNQLQLLNNIIVYKTLNYFVLLFELLAPILFFIKETCIIGLFLAILLHFGILCFMRIGFFSLIMFISLFYFYDSWIQILNILYIL